MAIALQDQEIAQIATIWEAVLGMGRACTTAMRSGASSRHSMSACVQITGAWQGAVVLGCPSRSLLAPERRSTMFNIPRRECASLTDMQDAIAELTNMIGGNLKGLLHPLAIRVSCHCRPWSPAADYTTRIPGSRLLQPHRDGLRRADRARERQCAAEKPDSAAGKPPESRNCKEQMRARPCR